MNRLLLFVVAAVLLLLLVPFIRQPKSTPLSPEADSMPALQPTTSSPAPSVVAALNDQPVREIAVATESSEAMDSTEGLPERDRILYRLRELARQDRAAALKWARELSNEENRRVALEAVCFAVGETNPREALSLVIELQLHDSDNHPVENLTLQWAEQDLPAAQAWVEQLPGGELRNETMARLAFVWSKTAPSDAAQYVAEKIPAGTVQTEAAVSVLHQWARQDLNAADGWARQFPEGPLRDRVIAEVAGIRQERATATP